MIACNLVTSVGESFSDLSINIVCGFLLNDGAMYAWCSGWAVAGKKILGSESLQHFLYISWHGNRYCFVLPIECDSHAEIDVAKRSYFKFIIVFF